MHLRGSDDGVLRKIIEEARPELEVKLDAAGRTLPGHVWRELDRYARCRDLSQGFAWLWCRDCQAHRLVPWTCQGRGFCPCCIGRRMAERAAFWVDHVLPEVGIRQWVLTVPWRVRWLLARHPHLVRGVVGIAWRAVFAYQAKRAAAAGADGGRCGASRRSSASARRST
ncbi:MAG: transposase zinc-binding domain-containing protein [Myxococcales bacterium]|nr:transposase zinc-binding domain-containing protein [Myxococcales bacterium]